DADGFVACPEHGWEFRVDTGEGRGGWGGRGGGVGGGGRGGGGGVRVWGARGGGAPGGGRGGGPPGGPPGRGARRGGPGGVRGGGWDRPGMCQALKVRSRAPSCVGGADPRTRLQVRAHGTRSLMASPRRPPHVLVVEDHRINREFLQRALGRRGYDVTATSSV